MIPQISNQFYSIPTNLIQNLPESLETLTKNLPFERPQEPQNLIHEYGNLIMGVSLKKDDEPIYRHIIKILNLAQSTSDSQHLLNVQRLIKQFGTEGAYLILARGSQFYHNLYQNNNSATSIPKNLFKEPLAAFLAKYPAAGKLDLQKLHLNTANLGAFKKELIEEENLALKKKVGMLSLGATGIFGLGTYLWLSSSGFFANGGIL
jgi:hypothetical protein